MAASRDSHPIAENWCRTTLNVVKTSLKWTIDNFSIRPEKTGQRLRSPTFWTVANDKLQWRLYVYPRGQKEETKDYVQMFLRLVACDGEEVRAKYKISFINVIGEEAHTVEKEFLFKPDRTGLGISSLSRNALFRNANSASLLPNDVLTVFCEVTAAADTQTAHGLSDQAQFKVPECQLLADLDQLASCSMDMDNDSQRYSDVTLSVGLQCQEFRVHKVLLAARSPVFAAMFKHDMAERSNSHVDIPDVNPTVMLQMLQFIYTGTVDNLEKMAGPLLTAADKYGLERLKIMCEKALCAKLSIKKVSDLLILADRHSAEHLKARCIDFISAHFIEVMKTPRWKCMITSRPDLIAEVPCAVATQHSPDSNPAKRMRAEH